jgi:hypothetical protein
MLKDRMKVEPQFFRRAMTPQPTASKTLVGWPGLANAALRQHRMPCIADAMTQQ